MAWRARDKFTSATTNKRKGKLFQTRHRCSDASVAAAAARIWLSAISQPQADASRINLATASSGFFPFMKAYVSHLSGSGTFFFLSLFSLVY